MKQLAALCLAVLPSLASADATTAALERRVTALEQTVLRLEAQLNQNPPPSTSIFPTGRCVVFGGASTWRRTNGTWKFDGTVENNADGTCLGVADAAYGLGLIRLKWQDAVLVVRAKDVSRVGG